MVVTRSSNGSSTRDMVITGEASVWPYAMVIRSMCISLGDALHQLDRAGRARHDAFAQAGEIEAVELGMLQFGDEHGGHAVERGGAFVVDRLAGWRARRTERREGSAPRR